MTPNNEHTVPASRRQRKSLGSVRASHRETVDKENMTMDMGVFSAPSKGGLAQEKPSKKSRSKSVGPGGLDALRDTSGNRRKSIAVAPKSILKPTLPPLPAPSRYNNSRYDMTITNPFQMEVTSIINDRKMLEQQEAEARERELKERERLKAEIEARRAARRKSLANRRVSFAPEATLHTWDVIEYMQDSTTSSASTNSTRRGSGIVGPPTDPPSTPPGADAEESPAPSRHKRRSSGIPPMNFNNPDDAFSSSPYSGGSSDVGMDDDNDHTGGVDDISDAGSDSMDDDETLMSMGDEPTSTDMSMASMMSDASSTTSSGRLDANLRLAARQAGTQRLNEDEDDEIIASFAPWKKPDAQKEADSSAQSPGTPADHSDGEADLTMDMTQSVGGILPGTPTQDTSMDITQPIGGILPDSPMTQEFTMEMTRPIGGILPDSPMTQEFTMEMTRPLGSILPRAQTPVEDMTMDMTVGLGGILPSQIQVPRTPEAESTVDMTMEMTRAVGGILPQAVLSPGGDMTMEMTRAVGTILPATTPADDQTMEMTRAVGGILPSTQASLEDLTMEMTRAVGGIIQYPSLDDSTMEITRTVGGIIQPPEPADDDMTMEMTRPVGSILNQSTPTKSKKAKPVTRRQSTRRRSSAATSVAGDETMEFTTALGRIQPADDDTSKTMDENEDMSMEFTTAIGGVLPHRTTRQTRRQSAAAAAARRRSSMKPVTEEDDLMDMTSAVGGIIAQPQEDTRNDFTIGMDMTTALGGILSKQPNTGTRGHARELMELETDGVDIASSPFRASPLKSPVKQAPIRSSPLKSSVQASPVHETDSPSLAASHGRNLRRSGGAPEAALPKSAGRPRRSVGRPKTPPKQIEVEASRPKTPSPTRVSPIKDIPTSSAKKLFKQETKALASPLSAARPILTPNKLFQRNTLTGLATPSIVLSPKGRRSIGTGLDRTGLGSPRVAALLDRRVSIGESSTSLNLSNPPTPVKFEDPRQLEKEVDEEREEEKQQEDGRKILEREADQPQEVKETTINLRGMIDALTPKKPLNGRKSLHVGAAKGVLGKRPVELDDDDDDEPKDGVKRLKGLQESPVKKIHLKAPPSADETTGRLTRSARKALAETQANSTPSFQISPTKKTATTPRSHQRYIDVTAGSMSPAALPLLENPPVDDLEVLEPELPDDRIHLQDFLNMTSIRFMELTTTKRRHTVAPGTVPAEPGHEDDEASFESCVVAGACTVPMLELYQHSCRELKKYISEGRRIVKEIEEETFVENPPLFREYMSASPDVKVLMDNQFKNVKTHARLLSKAMWYEWRMKLLENLINDGLIKTHDGLEADEKVIRQQEELLDMVYPQLIEKYDELVEQEGDLRAVAAELADCDPEALTKARDDLVSLDAEIEDKKHLIAELQAQLEESEAGIESALETKQAYQNDIREAEDIREDCRGWSAKEVSSLKNRVNQLEKEHGWTIKSVSGTMTSMSFRREIELVLDTAAFNSPASPTHAKIDICYIASNREANPLPLTMEKKFFLQGIRDHIRAMELGKARIKDVLDTTRISWSRAAEALENIRLLSLACPTDISQVSDSSILITSTLLLSSLETKVEIRFAVTISDGPTALEISANPYVSVIYGEKFNESKMAEFISTRIGEADGEDRKVAWNSAVTELKQRLLARGRK